MAQANGVLKKNEAISKEENNSINELEINLFADILRKSEDDSLLKIDNVQFSKATNAGDNYMSLIQRAHVDAIGSNGNYFRKYFILKRQLEDGEKTKLFLTEEVWANEEQMYKEILPRLRQHCDNDMPHPKYYYSDHKIIVLEDLKEALYVMGDRLQGLDLDQTIIVMKKLAAFHAASLAMQKIDPEGFKAMKTTLCHPYNRPESYELSKLFVVKGITDAIAVIKLQEDQGKYENVLECLQKIANDHNKYVPLLMEAPKSDLAVLIHGDLWINNILFTYDRTNKPIDAKFVDFQGSRFGSIVMDIQHVIFTSVQSKVRKLNFNFIFVSYYKYLMSFLKDYLGSGNEDYIRKFTYDRLNAELWSYRMYGLLNAIVTLPIVTCDSSSVNLPKTQPFNGDAKTNRYRQCLLDVVEDYIQLGWISLE